MDGIFSRAAAGSELDEIQTEVAGDERLMWVGKPAGGFRLQPGDLFLVPFSLMWGGFAFFWEITVLTSGGPLFFALWGVPFVLVGLYVIVGRFLVDAILRDHTFYGVTDKRAIIVNGWPGRNVQSVLLRTLTEINLKDGSGRGEGRGTITFGSSPLLSPFMGLFSGSGWPGSARYSVPSFVMIPQAREVYDLIQRAQMETMQSMQGAPGMQSGSGAETRAF